ncbi:MAG: hypothetical protein ACK47R_01185 [Planctomycetia bacterium]|jgi:hypothetical protein
MNPAMVQKSLITFKDVPYAESLPWCGCIAVAPNGFAAHKMTIAAAFAASGWVFQCGPFDA